MNKEQLNTEATEEQATTAINEEQAQEEISTDLVLDNQEDAFEDDDALFVDDRKAATYSGANQLSKTARLTQHAETLADEVLSTVLGEGSEYIDQVRASQKSHDAMDDLVNEILSLGTEEVGYLKTETSESIDKMIRSQQSKRSRAKAKQMTRENYKTMMVGAIAENLLRIAGDKPKSAGGAVMGDIGFSDEDIEKFAEFPEELKKAIRNIQSKKSIMKSKADFTPQNARYQQLEIAEQQLKEIRDQTNNKASEQARKALERERQLAELLDGKDLQDLPPEEAKKLLDSVQEMLASK